MTNYVLLSRSLLRHEAMPVWLCLYAPEGAYGRTVIIHIHQNCVARWNHNVSYYPRMSKSGGNYFRSRRLLELIIITVGHYYAQLNASFHVKIDILIPLHMYHAEILIYSSLGFLYHLYRYFEKDCRKKCTRQSRKVLWVVLSSVFFKEIWNNGTRGHGCMFARAKGKKQEQVQQLQCQKQCTDHILSWLSRALFFWQPLSK